MQARAGVGAQPDDVAGIGRNFRFEQNHIDHDVFLASAELA
jgi:hypothetical protein